MSFERDLLFNMHVSVKSILLLNNYDCVFWLCIGILRYVPFLIQFLHKNCLCVIIKLIHCHPWITIHKCKHFHRHTYFIHLFWDISKEPEHLCQKSNCYFYQKTLTSDDLALVTFGRWHKSFALSSNLNLYNNSKFERFRIKCLPINTWFWGYYALIVLLWDPEQ